MKSTSSSPIQKLQKALPISSLIWAAIVTAIVLAIAASANAQEENANTVTEPTTGTVRPLPKMAPLMPRATSTAPRPIDRIGNRPALGNASGTKPVMNPKMTAEVTRMAAGNLSAEEMTALKERRASLMQMIEARRASLSEKRALIASSTLARRALLKEEVQKRIIDRAGGLKTAAEKAIANLESMIARLREHADRFAARSVDVSGTLATLDKTEELLATAKDALDGIDTNVSYATMSDTPKEDWADAKEQFLSVRDILKEVRALLAEAVSSLKASTPSEPATN